MRKYEIVSDGKTVWINGATGLIGRFSPFGIDVHMHGRCIGIANSCKPVADWGEFCTLMKKYHRINVPNRYCPTWYAG